MSGQTPNPYQNLSPPKPSESSNHCSAFTDMPPPDQSTSHGSVFTDFCQTASSSQSAFTNLPQYAPSSSNVFHELPTYVSTSNNAFTDLPQPPALSQEAFANILFTGPSSKSIFTYMPQHASSNGTLFTNFPKAYTSNQNRFDGASIGKHGFYFDNGSKDSAEEKIPTNPKERMNVEGSLGPDIKVDIHCKDPAVFSEFADAALEHENWHFAKNELDVYMFSCGRESVHFITLRDIKKDKYVGSMLGTVWRTKDYVANLLTYGCLFIIPEYRGRGFGKYLLNEMFQIQSKLYISAYLNSTLEMTKYYKKKYGFMNYRTFDLEEYSPNFEDLTITKEVEFSNVDIVDHYTLIERGLWDNLMDFDMSLTGSHICRIPYLKTWFDFSQYTAIAVNTTDGTIIGYAAYRILSDNYLSVGPFYAENKEIVQMLLNSLICTAKNVETTTGIVYKKMTFTAFSHNTAIKELLTEYSNNGINHDATYKSQFSFGHFHPARPGRLHCISDLDQGFV